MASKLAHHRKSAFIAQSHRCFYCGFPMWESNIESFDRQKPATMQASYIFRSDRATEDNVHRSFFMQAMAPAIHILGQKKPTRVGFFVESLPA